MLPQARHPIPEGIRLTVYDVRLKPHLRIGLNILIDNLLGIICNDSAQSISNWCCMHVVLLHLIRLVASGVRLIAHLSHGLVLIARQSGTGCFIVRLNVLGIVYDVGAQSILKCSCMHIILLCLIRLVASASGARLIAHLSVAGRFIMRLILIARVSLI